MFDWLTPSEKGGIFYTCRSMVGLRSPKPPIEVRVLASMPDKRKEDEIYRC